MICAGYTFNKFLEVKYKETKRMFEINIFKRRKLFLATAACMVLIWFLVYIGLLSIMDGRNDISTFGISSFETLLKSLDSNDDPASEFDEGIKDDLYIYTAYNTAILPVVYNTLTDKENYSMVNTKHSNEKTVAQENIAVNQDVNTVSIDTLRTNGETNVEDKYQMDPSEINMFKSTYTISDYLFDAANEMNIGPISEYYEDQVLKADKLEEIFELDKYEKDYFTKEAYTDSSVFDSPSDKNLVEIGPISQYIDNVLENDKLIEKREIEKINEEIKARN